MRVLPFVLAPFALCGVAALALAAALSTPLTPPPPLKSVHEGAVAFDRAGLPELTRFQARDGTWLGYRAYPAERGGEGRIAILEHGSSASSVEMHAVAQALAMAGYEVVAVDNRGHGVSGTRGDIGYIGQLDYDLADLLGHLKSDHPNAKFTLIGHSSGGGFVARVAGGPLADEFERFVLLSPYLGYRAPTNRANDGIGRWVSVDLPRVLALRLVEAAGLDWGQAAPAIAFAVGRKEWPAVTPFYSYRLMRSYAAPDDWQAPFKRSGARMEVIAGEDDELMNAPAYAPALEPLGVKVKLVPGVDHMGVVYKPAALDAIIEAASS
jgi:pimeloyl-ACP methyl ester carboxylesterase